MDEFVRRLAEALTLEFPFLNGPSTASDAFQKAAEGIAKKMQMEHVSSNLFAINMNKEVGE